MIIKYEISKKSDGYTSISKFELNPNTGKFESFPFCGMGDFFIESQMNLQELKSYRKYKKSGSKKQYFYGIEYYFRNPAYQHICGTA